MNRYRRTDDIPSENQPGDAARRHVDAPLTLDELDAAYRATTYVAGVDHTTIELRIDKTHAALDRLMAAANACEWAYVTAWNPRSTATPHDVNRAQQQRLERKLEERGIRFFRGTSRPDDGTPGEESVLAFIGHDEAAELGRAMGQNAIVQGRAGSEAELAWLR